MYIHSNLLLCKTFKFVYADIQTTDIQIIKTIFVTFKTDIQIQLYTYVNRYTEIQIYY